VLFCHLCMLCHFHSKFVKLDDNGVLKDTQIKNGSNMNILVVLTLTTCLLLIQMHFFLLPPAALDENEGRKELLVLLMVILFHM